MSKKRIHYSREGRIEKIFPLGSPFVIIRQPRDAKQGSSGQIFLSYPHTHDRFLYDKILHCLLILLQKNQNMREYLPSITNFVARSLLCEVSDVAKEQN